MQHGSMKQLRPPRPRPRFRLLRRRHELS
jgi:hypothetical protein